MFIQDCFIRKNTTELKNKLKKLGYEELKTICSHIDESNLDAIVTYDGRLFVEDLYAGLKNEEWAKNIRIDCGDNEELFLAIAALRDDSDKYQWFRLFDEDGTCHFSFCNYERASARYGEDFYFKKATVEELIEYFKNK